MEILEKVLDDVIKLGETQPFNGELDFGEKIDSDEIFEAMRVVGMEESSEKTIQKVLESASTVHLTLLGMSLANYLQSTVPTVPPEVALKKSRRCVRFLLNLTQRSQNFASKVPSESVDLLETLLATRQFQTEISLFLLKIADFSYLEFQKSKRYSHLLSRLLVFSESESSDDHSTIFAYLSTLLEKDYAFLANCYAEMDPATFCEVLDVMKCILEEKSQKIHQNNQIFVLDLLELIVFDFQAFLEAKKEEWKRKIVDICNLLVEIVGEMCTKTEMTSKLTEKSTAINGIVDVLDSILHAEAKFGEFRQSIGANWPELPPNEPKFENLRKKIEEERKYEETQRKQTDRPKQPPISRIARIESTISLLKLSENFLEFYQNVTKSENYHLMGELKQNCLKAIANLCSLSAENRVATVRNGRQGLLSVLQCTARRPAYFSESYAMKNYAIFCVRQLTDECQENKEVILNLAEPDQPIIDRQRLLDEFGIEL